MLFFIIQGRKANQLSIFFGFIKNSNNESVIFCLSFDFRSQNSQLMHLKQKSMKKKLKEHLWIVHGTNSLIISGFRHIIFLINDFCISLLKFHAFNRKNAGYIKFCYFLECRVIIF